MVTLPAAATVAIFSETEELDNRVDGNTGAGSSHIGKSSMYDGMATVSQPIGSPTGVEVSPIGVKVQPTGVMVPPTGVVDQPTGLNVSPIGVEVSSMCVEVQPNGSMVSPNGVEVPLNSVEDQPTGLKRLPIGIKVQPIGEGMASVNPTCEKSPGSRPVSRTFIPSTQYHQSDLETRPGAERPELLLSSVQATSKPGTYAPCALAEDEGEDIRDGSQGFYPNTNLGRPREPVGLGTPSCPNDPDLGLKNGGDHGHPTQRVMGTTKLDQL